MSCPPHKHAARFFFPSLPSENAWNRDGRYLERLVRAPDRTQGHNSMQYGIYVGRGRETEREGNAAGARITEEITIPSSLED